MWRFIQFTFTLVIICGCVHRASGAAITNQPAVEQLHNLSLVVQRIGEHVVARDFTQIPTYDFVAIKAFQFLLQRPGLAARGKESQLRPALTALMTNLTAVQNAARNRDATALTGRYEGLSQAWNNLKQLYSPELLRALEDFSGRYACLAHPQITGAQGGLCSKCGRSLQRIDAFCGLPSSDPIIRASAHLDAPLSPGKTNHVLIRLARKDGVPVPETELLPTHTERIHMFAIDPTLTDYHHVHPQPTDRAGEFAASITPKITGGYRVWLDILPAASRQEEMPSVDLGLVQRVQIVRTPADEFTATAYHMKLSLAQSPLKAGSPSWATLSVTDTTGRACKELEPLMGNFAHFVAFHEDFQTVFHVHAAGFQEITDPALRAGPDVQLYFPALKAGFVRVFAQVKIKGEVITAPFGFQVQP